jgi:hypothetical protein
MPNYARRRAVSGRRPICNTSATMPSVTAVDIPNDTATIVIVDGKEGAPRPKVTH